MSNRNATTKRKKSRAQPRGRSKLTALQMQTILEDIEPKVRGLWGLSGEHHQRFNRHEDVLDRIMTVLGEHSSLFCSFSSALRKEFDARLRLHEYRGHGELVSMTEPEPLEEPKAPDRPQLRLLQGGLSDSAPRVPSPNRPELRAL
jgi:hypothetical protein